VYAFILYSISFMSPYLWVCAWCSFVPLLIFIEKENKLWKLILFPAIGFLCMYAHAYLGVFFFSLNDYLFFLLGMSVAIFPFVLLIKWFLKKSLYLGHRERGYFLLFAIPTVWTLYEYMRGSGAAIRMTAGGFFASSQIYNLPLLQIASLVGVYGLSFMILMINVALFLVLYPFGPERKRHLLFPCMVGMLVCVCYVFGFHRLGEFDRKQVETVRISLVQPNVDLETFNNAAEENNTGEDEKEVTDVLFELMHKAAQDTPDMIVLPERSYHQTLQGVGSIGAGDIMRQKVAALQIPTIVGGMFEPSFYDAYNSAYFLSATGALIDRYDKMVLYPLGEYIPGGYFLEGVMNDLEVHKKFPMLFTEQAGFDHVSLAQFMNVDWLRSGSEYTIFQHPKGFRFATPICAEDVFPELCREFVARGAQLLVLIINEAWWQRTATIEHHLTGSVLRAVENGVACVRATNTAYTGLILPTGKIESMYKDAHGRVKLVRGHITVEAPITDEAGSFFTKYGYTFPYLVAFLFCFFFVVSFFMSPPRIKS